MGLWNYLPNGDGLVAELGGDPALDAARIELRDPTDRGTALDHRLPERRDSHTESGDGAETCDDDST